MNIHDLAIDDIAIEQLVKLTLPFASPISLKDHGQLLFEVTQYKIVFQLTRLFQLEVETMQSCKTEVEEKCFRGGTRPKKRLQVLI